MRDLPALAEALLPIAARAGPAIMKIYDGGFTVEHKEDNSPLTLADLESQRVIIEGLQRSRPDIPDSVRGIRRSAVGRAPSLA